MAPFATGWQCYISELFTTVGRQCYRSWPCIDICIGNLDIQCTVCILESNKLEERITNVSLISEICKNKFQFLKDYVIRVPMGEICDLWVDVYRKHSYNLIWILIMLSNKFYLCTWHLLNDYCMDLTSATYGYLLQEQYGLEPFWEILKTSVMLSKPKKSICL